MVLAALLLVLVLAGALYVIHGSSGEPSPESWAPASLRRGHAWLGAAFVLLAAVPLLRLAPWVQGPPLTFWGDSQSHARVGAEIARTLLPHGWIESYTGGFPFGHHYPQLGWVLLALEMRMGLPPGAAVQLLGFGSTLAAPLVLYVALLRCRVRPGFAALGGGVLCCVSPYNPFVGGYETFFGTGLVSQVVALPLCIWLAVATVKASNRWEPALCAWLAMASHPQLTVSTLIVLELALVASGSREMILRGLRVAAFALIAGSVLYGQGIATLDIPFGWPPDLGWRQFGFRPDHLERWLLDGELLDRDRAPVLTALLLAGFSILICGIRRPANRALVLALVASLLLGVSGHSLLRLGKLGALALTFLQPLRVLGLIPVLAAGSVAVASEQAAACLAPALRRRRQDVAARRIALVLFGLVAGIAGCAIPQRWSYTSEVAAFLRRGGTSCAGLDSAPATYDRSSVRLWLSALRGGKLWYDAQTDSPLVRCLTADGVELASAVPIGTAAGVGAHVGVLARAAQYLDPLRAGSDHRAEALGIRYLLLQNDGPPLPGWHLIQQRGPLQLLSQGASSVGVGCITRRWKGTREMMRARLNTELASSGSDALLDPHRFIALEYAPGPVMESDVPSAGCEFAAATVESRSTEPGLFDAVVQSPTPVDVVFRVTAFPTWRVLLDGASALAPTLLAPGFFSVRVPAGRHQLAASVKELPGYGMFIALGLIATGLVAAVDSRRLRRIVGAVR
jgi:hypothetical protein